MNIKYVAGALITFPLLPLIYLHGKRIKKRVPRLPEATGTQGISAGGDLTSHHLLFIGESTIAGVGVATHKEGFCGTLADILAEKLQSNISWKVYARSGYTARRIVEKTLPRIEESTADLIVIGLGGNDAFTLNSPRKWGQHIRSLLVELKKRFGETPIVFINMPPIKAFPAFTPLIKFSIGNLVEILGERLRETIKEYDHVYYCDRKIKVDDWIFRLEPTTTVTDFFSDGVHPSRLAYQTWAKDTVSIIVENVESIKRDKLQADESIQC
jgi:lysophospholipase L1-like esterase